jgi:hypothetical protein
MTLTKEELEAYSNSPQFEADMGRLAEALANLLKEWWRRHEQEPACLDEDCPAHGRQR